MFTNENIEWLNENIWTNDDDISISFTFFYRYLNIFVRSDIALNIDRNKEEGKEEIDLLTENGAFFKMVQNTFNIKWRRLPVVLGL